jgi:hypothetical protein
MVRYVRVEDGKIIEECERNDSKNIAPAGKYSGRFNPSLHNSEEINNILFKKKKFYKTTEYQERKFRDELNSASLNIREISGDGNCLYRAVSDQIYGTENYYEVVKSKCMEYLEIEKDFFSQFIDGGQAKFDDYVAMKRMDGINYFNHYL